MTAISLGHAARPSRLGRTAITTAIKVGRLTRDSGGYSVGPAQVREQFGVNRAPHPRRHRCRAATTFGSLHPGGLDRYCRGDRRVDMGVASIIP